MSRALAVLATLVLTCVLGLASLAAPAVACACGAYIPDRQGAVVVDEKALVRWDGRTEDIVMALGVHGTSSKAAWIMPVPNEAEVALADQSVFTQLGHLTRPRVEYRDTYWPEWSDVPLPVFGAGSDGAPQRGGGVQIRGEQRLGPFDVTRLAADDPKALATWLGQQGFPHPPTLDANLTPYVEEGWEIVAIRLAPAEGGDLGGALQPLRLTFAADKPVYPMRLARSSNRPQNVSLYVLAAHKMVAATVPNQGRPTLRFAGLVDAEAGGEALAPYVGDGRYLTRYDQVVLDSDVDPISRDYEFAQAPDDEPFQEVTVVERDRFHLVGPALMLLLVLLAAAMVLVAVLRRRARMAP